MKRGITAIVCACILAACFSGTAMADGGPAKEAAVRAGSAEESGSQGEDVRMAESQSEGGGELGAQAEDGGSADSGAQPETDAQEAASVQGEWMESGEDWRYRLPGGGYMEKDWLFYKEKWYYLDRDGYMVTGMQRIDGKHYFFGEEGEMETGWVYDGDEEKWYYMNEDGTRKTGWLNAGEAWYWFDSKGVMYHGGFRMVSGHKYYFFENGQMAASQYVGTSYYNADGLRDRQYDMVIQGDEKPTQEEKDAITEALADVPREWMERFLKSGWEFMYYTDKRYFSAPMTDQGIYYVYHKTDVNYKKIKFTDPVSLARAFGEYAAHETGNDKDGAGFMVDFQQYLAETSMIQPLPSYFDDDIRAWFGILFEGYCDPEVRYDMRWTSPALAAFMADALGTDFSGLRPTAEELLERETEDGGTADVPGMGPAWDEELKNPDGPAGRGQAG